MCTSIAFKTEDFYFGRNMDIDYGFGEGVMITPRNYPFKFRFEKEISQHYAFIGMASCVNDFPLYAEGVNEKGLGMAGLNFPGNARYSESPAEGKTNLAVFEFIPYILSTCDSVDKARSVIENTVLINEPFAPNIPNTPLHWHIADREKSIVVEYMADGVHIYNNPMNSMTNNPPFDFHLTNACQYLNLSVDTPLSKYAEATGIKTFGKGMGSVGLPGDFSPASRFIKVSYILANSKCDGDEISSVSQYFHILDTVAVVKGSVEDTRGNCYCTTYSCCMNADKGIYYYKLYNNSRITAVNMYNSDLDSDKLTRYELRRENDILFEN